jgi:hypothetical protein
MNNVFTPAPSIIANYEITILWSHVWNEIVARASNNNVWSPNHFVPLLASTVHHPSDYGNRSPTFAVSYLSLNASREIFETYLDSGKGNV